MEFIFMLTHDDRTVDEAADVYRSLEGSSLSYVGFKDIGVPVDTLRRLTDMMHEDDRTVFLEVVSTSRDDELRSIEAALEIGVDYILGGTHPSDALGLLDGSGVSYCPFPGTVVGHPSVLQGSIAEISAHARELTSLPGVRGLDLLAYRHRDVDPAELARAVVTEARSPVIAAGSIDSRQRIEAMAAAGIWAFTIGGAIFENRLPGASVRGQVDWVLEVCQQ